MTATGTAANVRKYMETLRVQDLEARDMTDPSAIFAEWMPPKLALTVKDWFIS